MTFVLEAGILCVIVISVTLICFTDLKILGLHDCVKH